MRLLFIGDIFARPGRRAVIENVKKIRKEKDIDIVIANAENASHGRSLNPSNYEDLNESGVDIFTMGNHTWDIPEFYDLCATKRNIIRPFNVTPGTKEFKHGIGTLICEWGDKTIQITNLLSTQCMTRNATVTNPFVQMEWILKNTKSDIHIVDFHAETTSEKKAFLYAFAGRVQMIVGTHTHVQTNDQQIYKDTAFITDVGMCGAKESIIGAKPDEIVDMFKGVRPRFHLEPGKGPYQFNAVIVEFDDKTNKPISIEHCNINNN